MATKKKQKSVASVSSGDGFTIGASDVIRWDDVMTIQGYDVKVSKAVEMGLEYGAAFAPLLKKDLKSKKGLLITFPMMMLMSQIQERVELCDGIPHAKAGKHVLDRVKP